LGEYGETNNKIEIRKLNRSGLYLRFEAMSNDQAALSHYLESYTKDYPANAYMTSISDIINGDGKYCVTISRLVSCD